MSIMGDGTGPAITEGPERRRGYADLAAVAVAFGVVVVLALCLFWARRL